MVKFPDKCEWQNGFNPDIKGGVVWFTNGSKTLLLGCIDGV